MPAAISGSLCLSSLRNRRPMTKNVSVIVDAASLLAGSSLSPAFASTRRCFPYEIYRMNPKHYKLKIIKILIKRLKLELKKKLKLKNIIQIKNFRTDAHIARNIAE